MKELPKVTIKQVAEEAGVSASSVSMILNNRTDVSFSPDTVQRVTAAAQQLGYIKRKPSVQSEAGLAGSHTILVFSPNVISPYYGALLQSIEQSAREKGYDTLIYNTYRDEKSEKRVLAQMAKCGVEGIIFTMMPHATQAVEQLSSKIPTVVIGDRDNSLNVDTVETSNYTAGVLMAEHLIGLGHQHIAFVSTTLDCINTARTKRLDGLRNTFKERCPQGSILVKSRNITPKEERDNIFLEHTVGAELCRECLEDRSITAFVGVNDMVAYGIADALLTEGFKIPEDYSLGGFDNNFPSGFQQIALTTVEHCIEDKGHNAFDILYDKMTSSGGKKSAGNVITRVEYRQHLVNRASTGIASR